MTTLRTYGRTYDSLGNPTWVEVDTDSAGYNDAVYLTTLAQVLKLNLNESPFFANYGIPQYQTIMTQVFPDYYVTMTQNQFSQYFASLSVARIPNTVDPEYRIKVQTSYGSTISTTVPV